MPQSGEPLSLYFHIPFCTRKCDYCHFYVIPDKIEFQKKYMNSLKRELDLRWGNFSLQSIYFGGGTPSLLGPNNIAKILSWLSPLPPGIEITLETNPENFIGPEFTQAGINRVSMGVQSFDNTLLKTLSRTHSASRAIEALQCCKESGIDNISIDLMYDLPEQTSVSWEATLDVAKNLPITHLSLYNLTIEPHTVFYKNREKLLKQLPNETLSFQLLQSAIDTFNTSGLKRYEISAFAKQGLVSKHNIGYWTARPFLGFGPSAFSYLNGIRFRNTPNLNRYCRSLDQGTCPVDFEEKLSTTGQLKENLSLALRLLEGVYLPSFIQKWGKIPKETEESLIKLQDLELLHYSKDKLSLTKRGTLFYDTVAEELIE